MSITTNDVARLQEIKDEIKNLMEESRSILQDAPSHVWERAKGYWYAHILTALDDDSEFLGGSMCYMQDTIDSLDVDNEDEE